MHSLHFTKKGLQLGMRPFQKRSHFSKSIYLFVFYSINPILVHLKDLTYAILNPFSKDYQIKRTLNHNLLPF